MGRLKSMAANDEPLTVGAIRSHIQEVNKRARQRGGVANLENPVLSMPSEGGEGVIMHSMNRITGEAMSANRWARRGAFETLFDEYSRYLLKQNVEPNAAARSAMTMAELRSQRVHFDLSQMTNLEARNRWFMWFGTKHRLWSQWLARTAFTHPAAGVAVVEIKKWMEDANANEDPYDKHKIVFDAFGQKMKLNIATNFWFQDLPGESTMGALGERGLSTALGAAGLPTFTPSPVPFGYTTGRWDGAAIYVWEAIKAKDSGVLDADATLEDLQKYIDGWSPAEQKRWLPVIKEQRALATIKGEDIDSLEAFRRAIVARGKNEAWKLGRPLSITWESPAEEELQKQRDAAFLLTGYELSDYLEKHPAVAQSWNIYQNPAQQEREESAWKRFNQNRDGLTAELRKMSADGTIYDTGLVASTLSRYDGEIARWRQEGSPDYDPDFATVFGEAKEGKLREAISSLLPSADPENVLAGVRVPTKEEVTAYTQVLNNDLLKAASEQGFVPSRDANDEAYKRLKRDVVDVPLAHFQKYDPNEFTTQKTQRIAELLDRGTDAVGPTLAAQYLRGVENEQGIALLKRGSIGGKGKIHHALMGNLTPAEKKAMGWKSSFAAEFAWDQWSQEKHYLVEYMRKNGVVGNSKIGKAMWGKFDTWTEKLGTDNPDFGKELAFSKLDLHERMLELGVANPKTREGQGWGQFLSLITDMRADMKNVTYKSGFATVTGLTTLQGASAKPLNDEYLNKVVDMREKYPEWWREFTRTFSISSFGFYWQLESGADQELWAKEQVAQEQDALSQFYMFEDLSE